MVVVIILSEWWSVSTTVDHCRSLSTTADHCGHIPVAYIEIDNKDVAIIAIVCTLCRIKCVWWLCS